MGDKISWQFVALEVIYAAFWLAVLFTVCFFGCHRS